MLRISKYVIVFLLFRSLIFGQSLFERQYPQYFPEPLYCITFSGSTGWAAGGYGMVLKTGNSGFTFTSQLIPSQAGIKKIVTLDGVVCNAIDDSSRLYITNNGGNNWFFNNLFTGEVVDFDYLSSMVSFVLQKDRLSKSNDGGQSWSSSFPGAPALYEFSNMGIYQGRVFIGARNITTDYAYFFSSTDAGSNWNLLNLGIDGFVITGIYFADSLNGWISGSRFGDLYLMKTSDGGQSWTEQTTSYNDFIPNNIYFENSFTGYISSEYKVIKTTNGGGQWFTVNSFSGVNASFFSGGDIFFLADRNSRVYRTANGGYDFDTLIGKYNILLERIHKASAERIWCTGGNFRNFKTTNGGLNWLSDEYAAQLKIKYTVFTDANTGYAAAERGKILKTTNFGVNWNEVYSYTDEIYSISVYGVNVWAFGLGVILKSGNAGIAWNTLLNTENIQKSDFKDVLTGYGLNGNGLFRTTDGGVTWISSDENIIDFYFINSLTGWTLVNNDTTAFIKKTTNTGNNWQEISTVQENMKRIKFIDANTGYLLSDNKIYRSTNAGSSWKSTEFPSTLKMGDFDFKDENTGWICGENSLILKLVNGGAIFVNNETENAAAFRLEQNYPNPFNSYTKIRFTLPSGGYASLKVFDLLGREVKTLVNNNLSAGNHEVTFYTNALSSGVYFYALQYGEYYRSGKFILTK